MKQKILLIHPQEWFGGVIRKVQEQVPGIEVTPNFEQVLALARTGEVKKVCIMYATLTEPAAVAVQRIHAVDYLIPIQIWNAEVPETFSPREEYLNSGDFKDEEFYAAVVNFFED